VASEQSVDGAWTGHARGSAAYGRLLAALFCAGVATFAQLYSPQAVLPLISKDLDVGAANAALLISSSTVGLAIGVIPWSALADRIGRVKAISISVTVATLVGMLVPFAPTFSLLLAGRFVEGLMVGGVPAIAVAYLTEEVDPVHAARAAGIFVGGTTIGGLLSAIGIAGMDRLVQRNVLATPQCLAALAIDSVKGFLGADEHHAQIGGLIEANCFVQFRCPGLCVGS